MDRFAFGARKLIGRGCTDTKYRYEYGYRSQVALGLLTLAADLLFLLWRASRRELLDNAGVICFVTGLLLLYSLSSIWYAAIGSAGPRALLALLTPFFYTLGMVMYAKPVFATKLRLISWRFRLVSVVYSALSLTLVYEIYQTVVYRAATMYGGK